VPPPLDPTTGIHVGMAGYNRTRYVEELLERTDALQPSFTVHLHLEYWTLNNGSKFLYNNQIAVRILVDYGVYELTCSCSHCWMIYGRTGYQWTSLSFSKQLEYLSMMVRAATISTVTVD
jgi:hypothetical protein